MNALEQRLEISKASRSRMKEIGFGDQVTNICAGEGNPMRHCFFVEYKKKSSTNKYKVTHIEHLARCTDGKGRFFDVGIDVIYPGWLNDEERKELFKPVWESQYGHLKVDQPNQGE